MPSWVFHVSFHSLHFPASLSPKSFLLRSDALEAGGEEGVVQGGTLWLDLVAVWGEGRGSVSMSEGHGVRERGEPEVAG